jgi:signal peptidase I
MKNYYVSKMIKNDLLFYSGRSMSGTFRDGDRIQIDPCKTIEIKIGDVAIFISQMEKEKKTRCIHRIVAAAKTGFITRGDNNPKNDEEPVTEENLIGRVTRYERNGKMHTVWNGRLGMMRAQVLHGRGHFICTAKFFLRKPYRMIKKTGIVAKLWQPQIETVYFATQDGPLIKYLHNGQTVASCWTDTNCWWFRRPYDFIIDPKIKRCSSSNHSPSGAAQIIR